ncbi:hypothetical protein PENSPDRAFT_750499 [Peniophora sp. CONT]|nr:hypothetical protein PENSPDRAFT_750499 [Peniophora sp. CONT]
MCHLHSHVGYPTPRLNVGAKLCSQTPPRQVPGTTTILSLPLCNATSSAPPRPLQELFDGYINPRQPAEDPPSSSATIIMFTSGITTLVLLAVASVNGSPTPYDKRDPQFSVNLPNRLPVNGTLPFGLTITQGPNGNSIVTFGNSTTGGGRTFPFGFFGGANGNGRNTTAGNRPFPFNFLPFKRDEEIVKRDPQFSFNFPNRLPVNGSFPFGLTITQGPNGNSIATFGNSTTGNRGFPFNFLPFKRDEEFAVEKRDPQFSVNLPNRLPVNGTLPFGLTITQGPNGNSIVTFGNSTTGGGRTFPFGFFGGANGNGGNTTTSNRPFPFNFLPFKRDEEEVMKRDPQFSFNFPNRLPVTGNLPFGINIAQGADVNSIGNFGNATTGDRGFPLNFLPFKREEEVEAEAVEKRDPQFSFNFPNRLPVTGNLPFGINIAQGADGNSIGNFGNATTGALPFPFNFKRQE